MEKKKEAFANVRSIGESPKPFQPIEGLEKGLKQTLKPDSFAARHGARIARAE